MNASLSTRLLLLTTFLAMTLTSAFALNSTITSTLDFSNLSITPSLGTLEILSSDTPEFHLSTTSILEIQPGVSDGNGGLDQYGSIAFRFILHPDQQHQIGDLASIQLRFSAVGRVVQAPHMPEIVADATARLDLNLIGEGAPNGLVLDLNQHRQAYFYNENLSSDFTLSGFEGFSDPIGIAYGHVYTLSAYGRTHVTQIYDASLHVPDSIGGVVPLLTLAFMFFAKLRSKPRKELRSLGKA